MTRIARAKLAAAALLLFIPAIGLYAGFLLEKEGLAPTVLKGQQHPALDNPLVIGPPTTNRLDSNFSDTDGDLIADPPGPSQQINPSTLLLVVGDVPGTDDAARVWEPLLKHLSSKVNRPVLLQISSPEDPYRLSAMRQGDVHLAVIAAGAVPMAVNAAGFVPVAILPTDRGDGLTQMQLIVPATSQAQSPFQLRNTELVFVDRYSNAGFKAAVLALRSDFGLRPGREFTWRFSGSHQQSIQQIAEGAAAAAAVAADALRQEIAAGRVDPDAVRVIYQSEDYPSAAIGYAHRLDTDLAGKIRKAILSFDWRGTSLEPVLGSTQTRFLPANYREAWSLIRRIDDATGAVHALR